MTHTKGPWPIEQTGDGKRYLIGNGLVEGPNGYEVAEVYSDDCDPDEALANAKLIAAAPELLEAAERALNYLQNTEDEFGISLGCAEALRAAIAKAVQS